MAKFKKALALVLSLAMVLTLAPIANVQTKAAAKYKIKAATTAIAAGKTYNVKVTGVKKGQYVKVARTTGVTVKYNKKTIKASKKVAGTGKTLTFKVTVPDKVANYKSTIKAVIYNKKTNKKVKTLSTKRTVNVTEFSIASVVSTVDAGARGAKYIRATFTKALDSLDASEVEISNKATGQIFSVDTVKLASNGKSADIALVGDDSAAIGTINWLQPNTDYIFKVSKSGATANLEFTIPAVAANISVEGYDPVKKTITARAITGTPLAWAATADTYNVPDSIKVDYASLLGTTITVKYDKTNTITDISSLSGERVIYGAFKEVVATVAAQSYLQDVLTETKYYNQDAFSGQIPDSTHMFYEGTAKVNPYTVAALAASGKTYKYGKLVLNTNGTIKFFITLENWSGNILVSKTNGDSIVGKNNQEQTLKDYTILKDGKTIAVSDIQENDVVFFSTTYKMAEVYNNTKTAALEAVYDNAGFKFDGKDRDGSGASYLDGTTLKSVTTSYLKSVKAAGKDVTVYYDRTGTPIYVLGEQGASATTDSDIILTAAGDGFAQTTSNYIRVKGFNGKEVVTEDINISSLKTVTIGATKYDSSTVTFATGTGAAGTTAGDYSTKTTEEALCTKSAAGLLTNILTLSTGLPVGQKVVLTKDDKGVVTDLAVPAGVVGVGGTTTFDDKTAANSKFEKGLKAITAGAAAGANFSASTNVYVVNAGPAVTKVAFSDFAGSIANANLGYVTFYRNASGSSVTDVVVDNQNAVALGDNDDGAVTTEVVIQDIKYLDSKVSSISVINGSEKKTYSKFGNDGSLKTVFAKGQIVNVTVLKDGETVSKIAADTTALADTELYGVSTTAPGSAYTLTGTTFTSYSFDPNVTIVKENADGSISDPISLSDMKTLALSKTVSLSLKTTGNSVIDKVVVTKTDRGAAASVNAALDTVFKAWAAATDWDNDTNATTVATANGGVGADKPATAITTKDGYDDAVAAVKAADIVIADYNLMSTAATNKFDAANTANAAVPKDVDAYAAVTTAIKGVAKTLVVESQVIADATIAKAAGASAAANDALLAKLPTSVNVVTADGTKVTLTIPVATDADKVGATNQYGAWLCDKALAPATASTAHTFTLQAGTYNGVAYTFEAGKAPVAKVTTGA